MNLYVNADRTKNLWSNNYIRLSEKPGKVFLDVVRKLVEILKNEIALGKQVRTLSASLYLLFVYRSKKSSSPYTGGGSNFHSTGRETYRTEGHFSSIGIDIGRISPLCIS